MTEAQILLFALIFLRMIAFVFSSAFFGANSISMQIKVLFSIMLSLVIFPVVRVGRIDYLTISNDLISLAVRELVVGLSIGFLTKLFFMVVSMVGDLVSMCVGLSASQMYNPLMGTSGNILDTFYSTIGTLLFLSVNGHHMLINAICESYQLVPISSLALKIGPFIEMAMFGQTALIITIKMCAPVIVTILLVNLSMGILGRAVPQMNVLVTSMPVTIVIGMAVMFICLPLMGMEMNSLMELTADKLFLVMKHM